MTDSLGRAALCHEWLTTFGGSEQVSQRIVDVLGIDDVFSYAADPRLARHLFPKQRIHVHRLGLTRFARKHWQWLLSVMPRAWGGLDLSEFRFVITSSHACTNAIRLPADRHHISYCFTPMRYAWEWREEIGRLPAPLRPVWPLAANLLRRADAKWAQRVTLFLTSSNFVAERIRRAYDRASVVVNPPIETDYWTPQEEKGDSGFFLVAGRMVPYKRPDVAVKAATLAGLPLLVAGSGPELNRLKQWAGPTVTFVSEPTNDQLRSLYRRASALVFPGVEDFGLTPLEAQACGTPVVAFDAGGARETVVHGRTGVLYKDPSPEALASVLQSFDPTRYPLDELRRNAERFQPSRFTREIRRVVNAVTSESVSVAATDEFAERLQKDLEVERE